MAGHLNRCTFIGNLGADPEVRHFDNGGAVCNFSIACTESWRDKNTGEKRERTEWVRVTIYNEGLVKVCSEYLKKGSKVYIEGKMQTRKWQDQNGNDRYSTEIVIQAWGGQMIMLGGGQNNQNQSQAPAQNSTAQPPQQNLLDDNSQKTDYKAELDDEVPF